ncbi:hypothetical protein L1047_07005 [Synechococcus sp. Nb3U1]|uniref:hypothetical protein n=1 Tax=Synechococcus sp. Nb3U1 TaxID=1914529 RepID=UPI001F169949|nr:hypothetical protein [Synechococcus sp. Nb3U1]MCF2970938.1 hypothetical protein [Synechococcus sp. Nb3U1]
MKSEKAVIAGIFRKPSLEKAKAFSFFLFLQNIAFSDFTQALELGKNLMEQGIDLNLLYQITNVGKGCKAIKRDPEAPLPLELRT